jgi:hypothetical protein
VRACGRADERRAAHLAAGSFGCSSSSVALPVLMADLGVAAAVGRRGVRAAHVDRRPGDAEPETSCRMKPATRAGRSRDAVARRGIGAAPRHVLAALAATLVVFLVVLVALGALLAAFAVPQVLAVAPAPSTR